MSRTDKADWKIVWIFCGMLAVCSLLMMRIYLLSMSSGLQQAAAEQSSYTLAVTTTPVSYTHLDVYKRQA